jgi:hypothetical protein
MTRSWIRTLCVLTLVAAFAFSALAQGKDQPKGGQPSPEDMQKMMAEYAKYSNPGKAHELLVKMSGEWTGTGKAWMGAGAKAMDMKPGTHSGEMILGGRYLRVVDRTEMMGQPFEGITVLGYDNFKKQYLLTWMDNMGTAILTAAGTLSEDGKSLILTGKMDEPVTGEKDKDVKYVYRFPDDKTIVFEWWDMTPGKPFMSMEWTYTKK